MKKQLPTTKKSRSLTGWHKHLRRAGKKMANKGTRRALRGIGREGIE
jgi:hypothetical protein